MSESDRQAMSAAPPALARGPAPVRAGARSLKLAPWLFLAPGMAMFLVYVIIPIFQSVMISFYRWDGLGEMTYIGLRNYERLFGEEAFYTALKNNVIWLVLYMLALPAGLAIALYLNQNVFGIRLVKSLFFFPFVISQVVVGLIFSWFYAPGFGLLFKLTEALSGKGVAILAEEAYATYGVIAAGLWPQIAYCMILYLTGLNSINPEQIEAARMDGARGWALLWNIILPQLRPATFIAVVVTIIGALRSFDLVSVMTNGGPSGSTRVLSYYMFEKVLGEGGGPVGFGTAIAVVLFAIMLVFISLFIAKMVRDERS